MIAAIGQDTLLGILIQLSWAPILAYLLSSARQARTWWIVCEETLPRDWTTRFRPTVNWRGTTVLTRA
jgi:hypothetical protein